MHADPEPATVCGPPGSSRAWPWAAAVVLALCGIATDANTFDQPLVFDANYFILENAAVREIWPWFTPWESPHAAGANRPFGFLTFALNYACGGYDVWGYHAVNLAIHVAAAWLLFDLVRRTLSRGCLAARFSAHAGGLALAVALLWLVHPLQTNTVAYVYQRLESLMGLLYLATLWCFLRACESPRRGRWLAASVICCALGMATKEVMLTAPVIVLWYDRVFIAASWRELCENRGRYYAALAGTWGLLAGLMFATREDYASLGVIVGLSPLEYAQTQPGVVLHYLRLAFWPDPLCLDYAWPVARSARDIAPPALAIATLLGLTAWSVFRRPALGFLGAWFFLILAPTSSIAPLKDLAFEHRMYLPLAAVVALVVLGGYSAYSWLLARFPPLQQRNYLLAPLLTASVALTAVALAYVTIVRNRDYRSHQSIWQDTVLKRPQNARAHDNLANAIRLEHGDAARALDEYGQAIRWNPRNAEAYNNRGNFYEELGKHEQALADFDRALAIDPQYAKALNNRGITQLALGRTDDAVQDFSRAIDAAKNYAQAYANRGAAFYNSKEYLPAIKDFTQAIALEPGAAKLYLYRANAARDFGGLNEALDDYNRAIQLQPDFAAAFAERAVAYYQMQEFEQAARDVNKALQLGFAVNPQFVEFLQKATGRAAH